MNLFSFEIRKLIRQKNVWMLLIICLVLNIVFLYKTEQMKYSYTPKMYCVLQDELNTIPEERAYEWLVHRKNKLEEYLQSAQYIETGKMTDEICLYTANEWQELELLKDVIEDRKKALDYDTYIMDIKQSAQTMLNVSIFKQTSGFTEKNILKTQRDFSKLNVRVMNYEDTRAITMATGFLPTDLLAVIMLAIFAFFLVLYEKEQGNFQLVCSTVKGRTDSLRIKSIVFFVCILIVFICLYGENFIFSGIMYNYGNMNLPIQVVGSYQTCILSISILQYLLLFSVLKILVYTFIGYVIFGMCMAFQHSIKVIVVFMLLFGVTIGCYYLIPDNVALFSLKYLNLFYFLHTDDVLMQYKNVNICNRPIEIIPMMIIICFIGILLCLLFSFQCMTNGKVLDAGKCGLVGLKNYSKNNFCRYNSVLKFEYVKIIKKTGMIFILILFGIIQCIRIDKYSFDQDENESYYRIYMEYLEGPITREKDQYVQEETLRYDQLLKLSEQQLSNQKFVEWQQKILPYQGWIRAEQEYTRVKEYNAVDSDRHLEVVYDGGYKQLMGENVRMDLYAICIMGILMSLCISSVFSGDSSIGMDLLISTTAAGRRDTKYAKLKVTFFTAIIIFILAYGADFYKVYKKIGLSAWTAPLQSISIYDYVSLNIKIWQYLLLMYVIKFIGMLIVASIVLILSKKCRNTFCTMIFALLLIVLPVVMNLVGVDAVGKISLIPLLRGNVLLNHIICGNNFWV